MVIAKLFQQQSNNNQTLSEGAQGTVTKTTTLSIVSNF